MVDTLRWKLERCKWMASVLLSALFAAICWRVCCSCHTCEWLVLRAPADRAFIIEWFGWGKVVLNTNV
jgi:hypothetical protein